MQYLGGKKRIAKELSEFLKLYQASTDYYLEPFVGSAAVIELMSGIRIGTDINEYLIEMYKALQNGWIPPIKITEEEYKYVKEHKDENKPLTAFVGFGCSFSGKRFGGYARNKLGTRYDAQAHNVLLKQLPKIKDVIFKQADYFNLNPKNVLIYCDPPYANTTKYAIINQFDSNQFWEIIRKWSQNNIVFISEYQSPDDFECVLEINTKTSLRDINGNVIPRVERLFKYKGVKNAY